MPTVKSGLEETTAPQMQSLECYGCNDVLRSPPEYRLSDGLSVKTVLYFARLNRILNLKANSFRHSNETDRLL
jgi:hypothetical protein